jgi:hypothetical protein
VYTLEYHHQVKKAKRARGIHSMIHKLHVRKPPASMGLSGIGLVPANVQEGVVVHGRLPGKLHMGMIYPNYPCIPERREHNVGT